MISDISNGDLFLLYTGGLGEVYVVEGDASGTTVTLRGVEDGSCNYLRRRDLVEKQRKGTAIRTLERRDASVLVASASEDHQ